MVGVLVGVSVLPPLPISVRMRLISKGVAVGTAVAVGTGVLGGVAVGTAVAVSTGVFAGVDDGRIVAVGTPGVLLGKMVAVGTGVFAGVAVGMNANTKKSSNTKFEPAVFTSQRSTSLPLPP